MDKELDPILLRPEEAARVLRVGRSKVYQLIQTGEVPSVKLGKSVRVPVAALRERFGALGVDGSVGANDGSRVEPLR